MKPANEITSTTKPITRSGVWKKFSHVVLLLVIHRPAAIMGIDANRVNKFKNPITVLLHRYIFLTLLYFLSVFCSMGLAFIYRVMLWIIVLSSAFSLFIWWEALQLVLHLICLFCHLKFHLFKFYISAFSACFFWSGYFKNFNWSVWQSQRIVLLSC